MVTDAGLLTRLTKYAEIKVPYTAFVSEFSSLLDEKSIDFLGVVSQEVFSRLASLSLTIFPFYRRLHTLLKACSLTPSHFRSQLEPSSHRVRCGLARRSSPSSASKAPTPQSTACGICRSGHPGRKLKSDINGGFRPVSAAETGASAVGRIAAPVSVDLPDCHILPMLLCEDDFSCADVKSEAHVCY